MLAKGSVMLRRVENVQVFYKRDAVGLFSGKYKILVQVGRKELVSQARVTPDQFRAMAVQSSTAPVRYLVVGDRAYWRYQDRWHTDNEGLDAHAVQALLTTRGMRQDDRLNRARTIAAQGSLPVPSQRRAIPDDVKQLVWNRDGGACRSCASKTELQFDHMIPLAHGGGSTEDNLQILCGPCNRRKGASVV